MIYIREYNGAKRVSQVYATDTGYQVIGYYLSKEVRRDDFMELQTATVFASRWVNE